MALPINITDLLNKQKIEFNCERTAFIARKVEQKHMPCTRHFRLVVEPPAPTPTLLERGGEWDYFQLVDEGVELLMRCLRSLLHIGMKMITDTIPAINAQVTGTIRLKTMSTFSLAMTIENHLIP